MRKRFGFELCGLKVMSEFSLVQERLLAENKLKSCALLRGILKLAVASVMMRGTELPSVALWNVYESPAISMVVHSGSVAPLHWLPVQPTVHIQRHASSLTTLTPPLEHG